MGYSSKTSEIERYVFIECRQILIHIIGKDYTSFGIKNGINVESIRHFIKWNYYDYLKYGKVSNKGNRYLTLNNCIKILELSGYEIRLSLVLKNDTENEV